MAERQSDRYDVGFAMHIASCWYVGKMIGGDEDSVRDTLYEEVQRLRAVEAAAREVIDNSKHIEDYDVPSHLIRAIDTLRLSLGSLREGG